MSITLATIGAGILTGISHPITTFGLLTANTVMNGIELKNDSEMKGSLNRIESTQDKIIEGIETLQVSTSHTVTYSQMEKLLSEPVPTSSTQTVQQPVSNQAPAPAQTPVATTTPAPAQDNNPPAWAQQLMQQQNTASTPVPTNTTVNVNPTAAAPATTTPAATAPAPTTTPAPQTADESALDAKLDKLITGFAAFVDSFKQANAGSTPVTATETADTSTANTAG